MLKRYLTASGAKPKMTVLPPPEKLPHLQAVLVSIIASEKMGFSVTAAAADVVAADARFHDWFLTEVKGSSLSDDALLALLDVAEEAELMCRAAIDNFKLALDATALEAALLKHAESLNDHFGFRLPSKSFAEKDN
jgi:hypothetical protein